MDEKKPPTGRVLVSGMAAGAINGLFGGGGGAVLLPLLRGGGGLETRRALATCVGIMGPVCTLSGFLYIRQGAMDWALAWPYLWGGLLGGVLAGWTLGKVNPVLLRKLFALLLIWNGVRQWL